MSEVTRKYLNAIFDRWDRDGIEYAVLRNYEQLPDEMGNDLDLLIHPSQMVVAEQLLICSVREEGGRIHNRARFSCIGLFFYDPESLVQFHIDLFPTVEWRGFALIDTKKMLSRRQPLRNFYIPHPVDEAVVSLLTKLLYAGYVKDRYKESVFQICSDSREAFHKRLAVLFGSQEAIRVIESILSAEWSEIEQRVSHLRRKLIVRSLRRRPVFVLCSLAHDLARLFARVFDPPGICVVFIGPDGCGKTSVATGVNHRLEGTIHRHATAHLHWKPRLFKKMSDMATPHGVPCTDPHSQPLRSKPLSFLYFIAHSLEIIPAWLLRVQPVLFKNNLVIIDRYFFDFMVDPRRFRLSIGKEFAWKVYRLMPKSDIVICLDAPAEVLQSRKQEVSFEESVRQREEYRFVAEKLSNGYSIDATMPLDEVVSSSIKLILDHMQRKFARRGCK